MTVYSCVHEWDAMLTCIYVAMISKLGHQNIRLELEDGDGTQPDLFSDYIHVDADPEQANKLTDAILSNISPYVYHELSYTAMAYEADVLDNIYRVLLLGFKFGGSVLDMVQYRDVMRNREIRIRLGNEACRFKEIARFHDVGNNLLVAHIEPKSKIVMKVAADFVDRMPSENWVIVDDTHNEAVVHPKNEPYYLRKLDDEARRHLLKTEENNDEYTDLWKLFFNTIAIEQRINPKLQMNHMPLWAREHVVEFK